jgi:preprotein translocase subunit SecD
MRRRSWPILIGSVAVTVLAVIGVSVAGWRPLLGLDLQGGLSVVLRPAEETDSEQLDQAIEIIRNRVDALGVAEPDITRQGGNIVVSLPGVKDQQRALDLVGTTAELRFRPVLRVLPAGLAATPQGQVPGGEGATTTAPASATTPGAPGTNAPASTTAPPASTTTAAPPPSGGQSSLGVGSPGGSSGEVAMAATTTVPPTTAAPPPTTAAPPTAAPPSTAPPPSSPAPSAPTDTTAPTPAAPGTPATAPAVDPAAITPREQDLADRPVVLPSYDPEDESVEQFRSVLGPALATGDGVDDAQMVLNPQTGEPYVQLTFKDGPAGIDSWRAAAAACFGGSTDCPTGQLAIVLDGRVLSAPQVNDDFSDTRTAQITGQFSREEAQNLATALRYGALPVELERQQAQEVSATVGRDALRAGLVAGLLGLAIVSLYILAYYRLLGAVALASLALSFGLLWSIISWLGESRGLALSLSGVVGIIVSIGVSVDSNIVYFEVIKDDMHAGRTLASATERAFRSAIRTIVRADAVSLIGAGLLYWLTVGSVRGFAFYLGLATILDLVASYLFMRPAVSLLSRTRLARERPTLFGIPAPRPGIPAAGRAGTRPATGAAR